MVTLSTVVGFIPIQPKHSRLSMNHVPVSWTVSTGYLPGCFAVRQQVYDPPARGVHLARRICSLADQDDDGVKSGAKLESIVGSCRVLGLKDEVESLV